MLARRKASSCAGALGMPRRSVGALGTSLTLSQRSLNAPSTLPQRSLGARTETLAFARSDRNMQKPKFTARVNNIYFLSRIGCSLRWATQGLAPEELSSDVKHMLERLDELEAIAHRLARPNNDRA